MTEEQIHTIEQTIIQLHNSVIQLEKQKHELETLIKKRYTDWGFCPPDCPPHSDNTIY